MYTIKKYIKDFSKIEDEKQIIINHDLNCYFNEIDYIHIYLAKSKKDIDVMSYYSPNYQEIFKESNWIYNYNATNTTFYNNFYCMTPEKNKLIISRPAKENFREYLRIEQDGTIIKKKYKEIKIIIGILDGK